MFTFHSFTDVLPTSAVRSEQCLYLTQMFLGVWAILSACEWLANRRLLHSHGLLAWHVLRLRAGIVMPLTLANMLGSYTFFIASQVLRITAGFILLFTERPEISIYALGALTLTSAYVNFRVCFGGDGSDQMGLIVTVGAFLMSAGILSSDNCVTYAGIALISGQAFLAYFVAGVSKAASPIWRSGAAVKGVMQTTTFGHPWAGRVTSEHHLLSLAVGWAVIATEMLFPISIAAPPWLLLVCFVGFFIFHLNNAIFMGLNSFVFAFVATYPCIMKINQDIHYVLQTY